MWLCLFLCYSLGAKAATSTPEFYYGHRLDDLLNSPIMTSSEIRSRLHWILKSTHRVHPNGHDKISSRCFFEQCYQHRNISYKKARRILFGFIDLMEDDNGFIIRGFYCQDDFHSMDFKSKPPGPHRIPNHHILNTEHLWPQSRFSKSHSKDLQKSDLHNLQPTHSRINSSRGNTVFGETRQGSTKSMPQCFQGETTRENCISTRTRTTGRYRQELILLFH